MTFVHPELPGAYVDRLPTVPSVLPKAKVGTAKTPGIGMGCCRSLKCPFRCPRVTFPVLWVGRRTHKEDPGQAEAV